MIDEKLQLLVVSLFIRPQ